MAEGKSVAELERELKNLKTKRYNEERKKQLQKQIKEEKFKQTKLGKVVDKVGQVFEPKTQPTQKKTYQKPKQKDPVQNINEVINNLPK